ncbi:MAG: hypothetical protein EPN37_00475 [Chitinophagaceae bacterium]|nr:MAG: hypothetical protein EPN37_00475 [Chitinophagaceae bacterium]
MAISNNTRKKEENNLRKASDPYTLYLKGEPYTLTEESLKEQVDASLQRRRKWYFPDLKFISFGDGCLKLLNVWDKLSYEMTISVETDKLHVSCNCGLEVETLCIHSYRALERLVCYSPKSSFEKYCPKGLYEIATAHKKYFDVKTSGTGLGISPKKYLGTVYPFFVNRKKTKISTALDLQGTQAPPLDREPDKVLAYILIQPPRDEYLPFLIPCFGSPNKTGTAIKSFQHFVNGSKKESNHPFTEGQEKLNQLCEDMLKHAEKLADESLLSTEQVHTSSLHALFSLWEEALPLVEREEFIYLYYLHGKHELKSRPAKNRISKINVRGGVPRLHFQLNERTTFYQLQMRATIQGRTIKYPQWDLVFFMGEGEDLYRLSSLRDSGVAKWMNEAGNCITVFKEHFEEFSKDFLQPLQKYYPIEITNKKE